MGFKNGTHGSIQVAVDAIEAAQHAHHFLSVTKQSVAAIVCTHGNAECHVIMRGSNDGPNYDIDSLTKASELLRQHGLNPRLMVDCSHGNSEKIPANQIEVAASLAEQITTHASPIFGVMIESNLVGGRQNAEQGQTLVHGQSITDACLGWEDTVAVLETLASAVHKGV
jgi:3-deoxy-7-phosphoheptulonate synthase